MKVNWSESEKKLLEKIPFKIDSVNSEQALSVLTFLNYLDDPKAELNLPKVYCLNISTRNWILLTKDLQFFDVNLDEDKEIIESELSKTVWNKLDTTDKPKQKEPKPEEKEEEKKEEKEEEKKKLKTDKEKPKKTKTEPKTEVKKKGKK